MVQPWRLRVSLGSPAQHLFDLVEALRLRGEPVLDVDQYVEPVVLERGKNVILIKVAQNEQTEDWAQDWAFQLRVCDPVGTAIAPVAASTKPDGSTGR